LYFVFQAEDGIRDDLVTGVQTCALPIYIRWVGKAHMRSELGGKAADLAAAHRVELAGQRERPHAGPPQASGREMAIDDRIGGARSEERRVGKEGRPGGECVEWNE